MNRSYHVKINNTSSYQTRVLPGRENIKGHRTFFIPGMVSMTIGSDRKFVSMRRESIGPYLYFHLTGIILIIYSLILFICGSYPCQGHKDGMNGDCQEKV